MTQDRASPAVPALVTRVARAGTDDHRWFGHGALTELLGREDLVGLLATAACGRRLPHDARRMLDDLSVMLTGADPRIWPLKLCRLLASYGSTLAAFGGGHLCLDNDLIGPWSTGAAARTLVQLRALLGERGVDDASARAAMQAFLQPIRRVAGYGVPLRRRDERLDALRTEVAKRGWHARPHWRVQEAFSEVVQAQRGVGPNMAIGAAALLLDMGFGADEVPVVMTLLMVQCFAANAVEGARQRPAVLRALPAHTVAYVGRAPRASPRSMAGGAP